MRSRFSYEVHMISALTFNDPDRYRQLESSWSGASGVEEKDAAHHLIARLVTVAEHDDVGALAEQLIAKNVREQNPTAGDRHPHDAVTVVIIVVAAHERHRRNRSQSVEHVLAADVAGVKNRIDAMKRGECFGPDQTMRVGDDANSLRAIPRRSPSSPRSS